MENFISVFPNPVTNTLIIKTQNLHPLKIQLFDITGKSFKGYNNVPGVGTVEMDMSKYSTGSYFLEVKDTKANKVFRKLIIKRQ